MSCVIYYSCMFQYIDSAMREEGKEKGTFIEHKKQE